MKRIHTLLCLLLLLSYSIFAEDQNLEEESAKGNDAEISEALLAFEELKNIIQDNYAGYTEKVDQQKKQFALLNQSIHQSITQGKSQDYPLEYDRWLSFFEDPHLILMKEGKPLFVKKDYSHYVHHEMGVIILNPTTAIISIPSFEMQYETDINNMLQDQYSKLIDIENLIIDIRGNGGGSFFSMFPLLDLIGAPEYESSWKVWASRDNLRLYKSALNHYEDTESREYILISSIVSKMENNRNQFVSYTYPKINKEPQLTHIKKIYILADRYVASTAEEFILGAKHNPKVILVGEKTEGALDYGDAIPYQLQSEGLMILVPTQKRIWKNHPPIDNRGIEPDFKINPETENIYEQILEY
ncbi:S41 family peptidase [Spirochaeta cellobiosiphila]|uniref:S41 family peptidase n=1 Tax=Spirochaeta cellobiosiphila TaxID=504483 RepID=UPI0004014E6D|nr:S41 family peptidase [Spirochaeta cellobiosiphila]